MTTIGCVRGKLYLLLNYQHKSIGVQILIKTKDLSELRVFYCYFYISGLKRLICDSVAHSHFHYIDHLAVIPHPQIIHPPVYAWTRCGSSQQGLTTSWASCKVCLKTIDY